MTKPVEPTFSLPGQLEKILAVAAAYLEKQHRPVLQRLLVNSPYYLSEGWTYDNWDGGTAGHALHFEVPVSIYFEILDDLDKVTRELKSLINKVSNVPNEHIAEVFLELQDDPELEGWRENSGVLIQPMPGGAPSPPNQVLDLWTPEYLRLFLTHKATHKADAAQLKDEMKGYGVCCFVAHEDIEPTKEWQREIERALFSMDALAALMTSDFSESNWTDQELGVAIGRQVPIIPVRQGRDPYGFIGKYQGLPGSGKNPGALARDIYELLWTKPTLRSRLTESLVARFERSSSFAHANILMGYLRRIESAAPRLIDRLERAVATNTQVAGAHAVEATLPGLLVRLRGTRE